MKAVALKSDYDAGASLLEKSRWAINQAISVLEQARDTDNPGGILQALDRVTKLLVVEGNFLATEGPADKTLTISWEEPES